MDLKFMILDEKDLQKETGSTFPKNSGTLNRHFAQR